MDPYSEQQYGGPQLFEDTSNYGNPGMFQEHDLNSPQQFYPGQEFLQNNPGANMAANMAMQYGQTFVPAAGEYVEKKVGYIHLKAKFSRTRYLPPPQKKNK